MMTESAFVDFPERQLLIISREYFTISFSSTDYLMVVRSTSLIFVYLLLLVDLVPLTFLGGDFLGREDGFGSIGLAGGDIFATNSFNLFDFKLERGTFGITYLPVLPDDVDGKTSGVDIGVGLGGVHSLVSWDGVGTAAIMVLVPEGLLALDVEAGCFSSSLDCDRSPDDKSDDSSRVLGLDVFCNSRYRGISVVPKMRATG